MNDFDLLAMEVKQPFLGEAALEQGHESTVQLDGIKTITGLHLIEDLPSHRPGAGTDLQNSARGGRHSVGASELA